MGGMPPPLDGEMDMYAGMHSAKRHGYWRVDYSHVFLEARRARAAFH